MFSSVESYALSTRAPMPKKSERQRHLDKCRDLSAVAKANNKLKNPRNVNVSCSTDLRQRDKLDFSFEAYDFKVDVLSNPKGRVCTEPENKLLLLAYRTCMELAKCELINEVFPLQKWTWNQAPPPTPS
mmetsp:Transcript_48771/g.146949  ORF Transcript_48771/g.146949 Transcript_48771/m.146949 type:complete len:129 (+) Transcript_48771:270-656(+)